MLLAVDPLGVLAARHLHRVRRLGELHLGGASAQVHVEGLARTADEVRRAGEHLDRGHAGGERPRERRVLRPEGIERADLRGDGCRRLVAVVGRVDLGLRVDAHVRVGVDDPRRHEAPGGVDDRGAVRDLHVRGRAHRADAAVLDHHDAVLEDAPRRGHHRAAGDGHERRLDLRRSWAVRLPREARQGRLGRRLVRERAWVLRGAASERREAQGQQDRQAGSRHGARSIARGPRRVEGG